MTQLVRTAASLVLCLWPAAAAAQDLTPRAYLPLPISSNAFVVTYQFADGELLFDPTLPIEDARGTIHAPVVSIYHAFNFFGRSANVTASLPFAVGHLRGTVSGQDRTADRAGVSDVVARVAVNIVGGPAQTMAELLKNRPGRALLGASVKVVAPSGEYDPTLLVNIGSNRWAFKPEIGYMQRAGPFVIDAYAGMWFFTSNDEFYNGGRPTPLNTKTQEPITALEFHVSYDVKPRLWISADVNYWRGGRTSVNGGLQIETLQANSRIGLTGSVPLTSHQSIKVSYSDGVFIRIGGNFRILSAAWQYGWLGMPFQ